MSIDRLPDTVLRECLAYLTGIELLVTGGGLSKRLRNIVTKDPATWKLARTRLPLDCGMADNFLLHHPFRQELLRNVVVIVGDREYCASFEDGRNHITLHVDCRPYLKGSESPFDKLAYQGCSITQFIMHDTCSVFVMYDRDVSLLSVLISNQSIWHDLRVLDLSCLKLASSPVIDLLTALKERQVKLAILNLSKNALTEAIVQPLSDIDSSRLTELDLHGNVQLALTPAFFALFETALRSNCDNLHGQAVCPLLRQRSSENKYECALCPNTVSEFESICEDCCIAYVCSQCEDFGDEEGKECSVCGNLKCSNCTSEKRCTCGCGTVWCENCVLHASSCDKCGGGFCEESEVDGCCADCTTECIFCGEIVPMLRTMECRLCVSQLVVCRDCQEDEEAIVLCDECERKRKRRKTEHY